MHFADLGFKLTSVEPVVGDESNPYALREEDLPKIFEEYEKFAVEYADRQLQGDGFKFFHFMIDLNQGPCVIKRITGCGAGNEYLSVTPNGDIYPCHQFVGNEEFKMANIFDEEIVLPENLKICLEKLMYILKKSVNNVGISFTVQVDVMQMR